MRILFLFFCFWGSQLFADQHVLEQENFEAWQFACVQEQSQKLCDLRELVFDSNTNEVVSYLSITINPDALTQMQIAFPHAVNLKSPVQLQIDDKAKEWLLKKGFDSKFGARPMRRTLEKYIQNPLSEMIIQEKIKNGDTIYASANDFGLEFRT